MVQYHSVVWRGHTGMVQMKNWDPFVLGPALAMLRTPSPVCFTASADHTPHATRGNTETLDPIAEQHTTRHTPHARRGNRETLHPKPCSRPHTTRHKGQQRNPKPRVLHCTSRPLSTRHEGQHKNPKPHSRAAAGANRAHRRPPHATMGNRMHSRPRTLLEFLKLSSRKVDPSSTSQTFKLDLHFADWALWFRFSAGRLQRGWGNTEGNIRPAP